MATNGHYARLRDVRGRPPRNPDVAGTAYCTTDLVGLRMSSPMIAAVDAWRQSHPSTVSRSEAIRSFVAFALTAAPVLDEWSHDPRLGDDHRTTIRDLMLSCGSVPLR